MRKPFVVAAAIALGAVALTGCATETADSGPSDRPAAETAISTEEQFAADCGAFGTYEDDWAADHRALGVALFTETLGSWPEDIPAAQAAVDSFERRLTGLRDGAQSVEARSLYDQALTRLDRADEVLNLEQFAYPKDNWGEISWSLTDLDEMCAAV